MYCTRCGTLNSDELTLCTNCSAPLVKPGGTRPNTGSSGSAQIPYPYANPGQSQQQNPQPYSQKPSQPYQPYPSYPSTYSAPQSYQPYPSSFANQMPVQQSSASGRAIAAMVLSICGIVTCLGPLLGIPGLILGKMEMNAIKEGQAPRAGETFAKIGFYLGIAEMILFCFGLTSWMFWWR